MRQIGAAEPIIVSMFKTIQKLKYTVRTAFGDTKLSFGGEEWRDLEALMGIRQGNGAELTIWAVISLVFFNVLREIGYGAILKVPFSNNELYIAGFGFVDSTDILQTGLGIDYYWETAETTSSSRFVVKVHRSEWRVFSACYKLVDIGGLYLAQR